jgi:hypothetical protein
MMMAHDLNLRALPTELIGAVCVLKHPHDSAGRLRRSVTPVTVLLRTRKKVSNV